MLILMTTIHNMNILRIQNMWVGTFFKLCAKAIFSCQPILKL
ncbi:hypothetical protein NITGR_50002 [Nitrospina gracilis 3/211]|uniref:Uncharacterized protein n=1 Tax=Nitrospina gracilis (strain 3/211) TaxID=1266370 RepID=M1Z081_NITG3|nr:hypothetical protein NITGR_50002 [Nitrospina gracilis 3/211]